MSSDPDDGRSPIDLDGFSYLPKFISTREADELIEYFAAIHPIWEQRHGPNQGTRAGGKSRRITRPVYWLGAWQFASLGYYAEPDHREGRCLRAERFPAPIVTVLGRLEPVLRRHAAGGGEPGEPSGAPNTCLINYYGSETGAGPPVDQGRLRMHRDGELGPIVMFCIGQPGLLEFVDVDAPGSPRLSVWTRHRSVVVFSGPTYKDQLYHQLVRVRHGHTPELSCTVENFSLRRVSVSFRHVPDSLIADFEELPSASQALVRPYVEQLARRSQHYRDQLSAGEDEARDGSDGAVEVG